MVNTREQAARTAEATKTNVPGTCQLVTRGYYLAPSAGDFDGDGRADAEDGWKTEPIHARHFDRNPPRGAPVSFLGGRNDDGHRAISLGGGLIRSTDFNGVTKRYQAGVVGNGTVDEVARAMGVTYAGWSDTIDGILIPQDPPPVPKPAPKPAPKPQPKTRGKRVVRAIGILRGARDKAEPGKRRRSIKAAIQALRGIEPQ